jgi:pimeloyl-ACP methyl ester carboxylesterase
MLHENTFDTGAVVLNYVESANPGPPLLLLHGLTVWWRAWENHIPRLTPAWRVTAPDFRGHGKSGRADTYRLIDYRDDIVAFLRGHFTEPVVIMGHALGGLTAIAAAALVPERVRALVLLDPPLHVSSHPLADLVNTQDWFKWVYDTLKSSPSYDEVLARCREWSPNENETLLRVAADNLYSLDPNILPVWLEDKGVEGWSLEEALASITCPMLLMRGDWSQDATLDDDDAALVRATVPQVEDIKIPYGTPLFPWQQMDKTLAHVERFLAGV